MRLSPIHLGLALSQLLTLAGFVTLLGGLGAPLLPSARSARSNALLTKYSLWEGVRHAHCNIPRTFGRTTDHDWLIKMWSDTGCVRHTAAALQKTANGLNIAGIADSTAQVRYPLSGVPCRHNPAPALQARSNVH